MKNHLYHIMLPPLNVTIFIMYMGYCIMAATPMAHKPQASASDQSSLFDYTR